MGRGKSVEKRKLISKEYLGDGDTSSFKEVVGSEPYKQFSVEPVKQECVGHIQKRVGKRLRDRIKTYKGTKTPISGAGKLTNKVIDSLQNFYGLAKSWKPLCNEEGNRCYIITLYRLFQAYP